MFFKLKSIKFVNFFFPVLKGYQKINWKKNLSSKKSFWFENKYCVYHNLILDWNIPTSSSKNMDITKICEWSKYAIQQILFSLFCDENCILVATIRITNLYLSRQIFLPPLMSLIACYYCNYKTILYIFTSYYFLVIFCF